MFQLAGKRQVGAMLWGKSVDNKLQYQAGIYNGVSGAFFDLDKNKDFIGAFTVTPFKGGGNVVLDSLGFGAWTFRPAGRTTCSTPATITTSSTAPGSRPRTRVTSRRPASRSSSTTTTSAPAGERTKIAPHFFWFGRFSVLGEYVVQSRQLANSTTTGTSVQHGYLRQRLVLPDRRALQRRRHRRLHHHLADLPVPPQQAASGAPGPGRSPPSSPS